MWNIKLRIFKNSLNIKLQIFWKNFNEKLGNLVRKVLLFLLGPLFKFTKKRDEEKYRKRVAYNLAMSEEELMLRYAKHLTKEMIQLDECNTQFVYCEAFGLSTDRDDFKFILYDLCNLHGCKDKYLKNYWMDAHLVPLKKDETVEKEKRLNTLLKNEFDKMGFETYYKVSKRWTEAWMRRTGYVHTLVIKLP